MKIYVYSDESGVFDVLHNRYFVYGGLILLGKEEKDACIRKYKRAEKAIRSKYPSTTELKASIVSNHDRSKLFRSLNQFNKFGAIVYQERIIRNIFDHKKSKQRYLDYAYKIGLKTALSALMSRNLINPDDEHDMYVFVDEHTTATDGRYELEEGLRAEYKDGTYNYSYDKYYPPILPNLKSLTVKYCNSETMPLIRGADIIANRLYHHVTTSKPLPVRDNLFIKYLP